MIASLYAGITGLNANATAMTVIGDNIANVNTTAFKSNRSYFANVLSSSLRKSELLAGVGRGVEFWGISAQWTQGSLENSASVTDMAVNGKGFFIVQDGSGSNFYTRAGKFNFDKDGYLVNPDGLRLQGYELDADGNIGRITSIFLPGERVSPPSATTEFNFDMNLSSAAEPGDTYTSTQTVYDSLGNAIPITFTFTRAAADRTWTVAGSVPETASTATPPVTFNGNASLTVAFDADGNMDEPAALPNPVVEIALTNGATPLSMDWALYDASGNSYGDVTGYASESGTTFQYQDGYPTGTLRGINVDESGIVTATYSNGQLNPMYQVALADFASYDGLTKMGRNLYGESLASGQVLPGLAGTGRLGSIAPSTLEMSNVDLAEEFVKMITTQRAFQANSRVITASDEILTELINIKR